ncbi:MAG: hypothetical protein FWE19_04330 [Oscillospiraceae bacterium]|nr:hypothetical protein [Oscillospiraceae bacterium]
MSNNKKMMSGGNIAIFLLGIACGMIFGGIIGRILFGIVVAVLVAGAAFWIACGMRKM